MTLIADHSTEGTVDSPDTDLTRAILDPEDSGQAG